MAEMHCPLCKGVIGEGAHMCLLAQQKSKGIEEPVEVGSKVEVSGLVNQRDLNGAVGLAIGVHSHKGSYRVLVKFDPPRQHLDAMMFKERNIVIRCLPVIPPAATEAIGGFVIVSELVNREELNGMRGQVMGKQFNAEGVVCYLLEFPSPYGRLLIQPQHCAPTSPPLSFISPPTPASTARESVSDVEAMLAPVEHASEERRSTQAGPKVPAEEQTPVEEPTVTDTPDLFGNLTSFSAEPQDEPESTDGLVIQFEKPASPTMFDASIPIPKAASQSAVGSIEEMDPEALQVPAKPEITTKRSKESTNAAEAKDEAENRATPSTALRKRRRRHSEVTSAADSKVDAMSLTSDSLSQSLQQTPVLEPLGRSGDLSSLVLSGACSKLNDYDLQEEKRHSRRSKPSKKISSSRSNASTCGLSERATDDTEHMKPATVTELLAVGRSLLDEHRAKCSTIQDDLTILVNQSSDATTLLKTDIRQVAEAHKKQAAHIEEKILEGDTAFMAAVDKYEAMWKGASYEPVDTQVEERLGRVQREKQRVETGLQELREQERGVLEAMDKRVEALAVRVEGVEGERATLQEEEAALVQKMARVRARIREIHEKHESLNHEASLRHVDHEHALSLLHTEAQQARSTAAIFSCSIATARAELATAAQGLSTARAAAATRKLRVDAIDESHCHVVAVREAKRQKLLARNKLKYSLQHKAKEVRERGAVPKNVEEAVRKAERQVAGVATALQELGEAIRKEEAVAATDVDELEKRKKEAVAKRDFKEAKAIKEELDGVAHASARVEELRERRVKLQGEEVSLEATLVRLKGSLPAARVAARAAPFVCTELHHLYDLSQLSAEDPVLYQSRATLHSLLHKNLHHTHDDSTAIIEEAQTIFDTLWPLVAACDC